MNSDPEIRHRKSIRLKGYDYSKSGVYFITICIKDRNCIFGKIVDGEMILSDTGNIANEYWLNIPEHFPNVKLHEHIVMPNHVHGIIELINVGVQNFEPLHNDTKNIAGVPNLEPLQNQFQRIIPYSIGSIIRGYKVGVTKWLRANNIIHGKWQRNFHEHIIRNEQSYYTIANYIITNPKNWREDKFYTQQL